MQPPMEMLREVARDNGWAWTLPLAWQAVLRRLRSAWAARILGAPGLSIGPGCELLGVRHIRWGRDVSVRSRLWLEAVTRYAGDQFEPRILIGNRVAFSDGCHITAVERVEIGSDVLFGSHVFIADHNHGSYGEVAPSDPAQPPTARALGRRGVVVIEDNVWVADGANIVGPVRIGFGAIVAAHAVVRHDVPPRSIVAGSPARVVKVYDSGLRRWVAPISVVPDGPGRTVASTEPP